METIEIKRANKQIIARESMLEDSKFSMVCLDRLLLDDIKAVDVKITNANLTNLEIEGAQLGGAFIHNIGMPPMGHPNYDTHAKHRPVRFEDCDLTNSTLTNCNLSGVVIGDCNITDMVINGVLVTDLLKAYHR